MKLKFEQSLDFQQDAINAVLGVFEGQAVSQFGATHFQLHTEDLLQNELGMGNQLTLPEDQILANVQKIQETHQIEKVTELQGREFSIEMETGTGKTYVYLRTIFELNQQYGFSKFIVVVPSIAVREGVLKSIDMMKDHFRTLYGNVPFDHFVYDSKRLGEVRQFATSNHIQIMIINIQAFIKDVPEHSESEMTESQLKKLNIINRENDRMSGHKPIEFIQATNPLVIIDEPQSVDNTEKAKRAIQRLKPAATFRYSATHKNPYNLLYRLDPIKAYDLELVKRIEVASIRSDNNFNDAYVKLLKTDNKKGIKAQVELHKESKNSLKASKLWVKQGDNLFIKSGKRFIYEKGYIIQNIDCTPGAEYLELSSGKRLSLGQEIGGFGDDLMKEQIVETVEQHLKKVHSLKDKGIKVLSLFFIDKVANYRIYHEDNTTSLGKIGKWFEEAYQKLTTTTYNGLIPYKVEEVHGGYFSQDKQGHAKDTRGNTKDDETTYNLIMQNKERLLDEEEPLRFIFSHSALREGWDNPNVFQICTLNETRSIEKKRQEIGRGLRLPVNNKGVRVRNKHVNRLTVIANESYEEFARTLQTEFEEDCGIEFGKVEKIAFSKLIVTHSDGTQQELGQEGSAKIWQELVNNGYLNGAGEILNKFDPKNLHFVLNISSEFEYLKPEIIETINKKVFKNRIANARERRKLKFQKEVYLSQDFKALWEHIKHRTRYRVSFETHDLIEKAVARIKALDPIQPIHIVITRVELGITEAGVDSDTQLGEKSRETQPVKVFPDILSFLQQETELTRHTLMEILKQSGRLADFKTNPQAFLTAVAKEISHALHDLMLKGIQYNKIEGHQWEMSRIEQEAEKGIVRYLNNLYEVQNHQKALFDAIECDSNVEQEFAKNLDTHEEVHLFVKLPN